MAAAALLICMHVAGVHRGRRRQEPCMGPDAAAHAGRAGRRVAAGRGRVRRGPAGAARLPGCQELAQAHASHPLSLPLTQRLCWRGKASWPPGASAGPCQLPPVLRHDCAWQHVLARQGSQGSEGLLVVRRPLAE